MLQTIVMPGLDPGIYAFAPGDFVPGTMQKVDGRDTPGHDGLIGIIRHLNESEHKRGPQLMGLRLQLEDDFAADSLQIAQMA